MELATAAVVVLINENGQVLANTRRNTTNNWGLIGGKVEFGEFSVDAAIREFEEEVGISLEGPMSFLCQKRENDTIVDVYIIVDADDIYNVTEHIGSRVLEREMGILLAFVPYSKLLEGSFGQFNGELITDILGFYVYPLVNEE